MLVGGGDVSRRELVEHLASGRPVVVVSGTGRLADAVADGRAGAASDGGPGAPSTADDLGALLANGDVHVVSLDDSPERLRQVLASLLAPARRRRLRERFALLAVLPRWRFRPAPPEPLLALDAASRYPLLREQIVDADRLVYPFFAESDMTAQIEQNRHRWFAVLAIGGGLLTTVFGALQAWLQTVAWPGVVVATLGAATSALITVARRQGSLLNYLTGGACRAPALAVLRVPRRLPRRRRGRPPPGIAQPRAAGRPDPVRTGSAVSNRRAEVLDAYRQHRIATQRDYYSGRAEQNETARRRAVTASAALLVLAALFGALATADIERRAVWAVVAASVSALATALMSYESAFGFERLARRYSETCSALALADAFGPGPRTLTSLKRTPNGTRRC